MNWSFFCSELSLNSSWVVHSGDYAPCCRLPGEPLLMRTKSLFWIASRMFLNSGFVLSLPLTIWSFLSVSFG